MNRHHHGSGRRRTIHPDWSEFGRPPAAGGRTATVEMRHPGGTKTGALDPETGTYPTTPFEPYYIGSARVQTISDSLRAVVTADEQITTLSYRITVDPTVTEMEIGDIVKITGIDKNGDLWMLGRIMTVQALVTGSLQWERHLVCVDDMKQTVA